MGTAGSLQRGHAVFAYGSNMHLRDVARWMRERGLGAPRVEGVQPAVLPEHRLAWCYRSPTREGGAANVLPADGCEVPGLVLWVDDATFDALDRKEWHPTRYDRGPEPLALRSLSGEPLQAWVYRVTEDWLCPEPEWPRASYLRLLVEAAREYALPGWHRDALLHTATVHPHVGVVVRTAVEADAPELAETHVRAWQHAYRGHMDQGFLDALDPHAREASWRESLRQPESGATTWAAVRDGCVIGFAIAGPCRDRDAESADAREIYAMYARPHEQGRGVGRALMERISWLFEGHPTSLWVLEANDRARRFYRQAGFRPDGAIWNKRVGGRQLRAIRMRREPG